MARLEAPIAALFRQLQTLPVLPPLDSEAMLWSQLCAQSLARYEDFMRRTGRSEEVDPSRARRLRRRLDKLLASKRARSRTTPRMRAALTLLRLVRDEQDQGARRTLDSLLRQDVRDTWAVFYSYAAAFRLSAEPDWRKRWTAFRRRIAVEIVATKTDGVWPLREGDGMNSVSEKTALHCIMLQIYYRYCDLHFAS